MKKKELTSKKVSARETKVVASETKVAARDKVTKSPSKVVKPAVKAAKSKLEPAKLPVPQPAPLAPVVLPPPIPVVAPVPEVRPEKAVLRPGEVPLAIRKLLDTTNHIQARATELENALDALHEYERCRAVKELLLALRFSPDGDLLRFDPAQVMLEEANPVQAVLTALTEAFAIEPVRSLGERIPVSDGEIPDNLELDRSIGEEPGTCHAVEVVSVGWQIKDQTIVKPLVRPLFN